MKVLKVDYTQLSYWSQTDLAYIRQDEALMHFAAYVPEKARIPEVIRNNSGHKVDRSLLLNVLKKQYAQLGLSLPIPDPIFLNENTFTVTTAHQPTLLTGPLFHIYKIASTIHLAKELSENKDGHTYIPFFIMNAEDHDWPEVNHLYLFGRKYEWDRKSTGPSGRLSLEGLDSFIKTITDLFANAKHGEEIKNLLEDCLSGASHYGEFHRLLLHRLFGQYGLVILDMDDADLKRAFIPVMEKEIREQFSLEPVSATQSTLEKSGFKAQAFCRPINLFYMTDELRERLDPHEGGVIRVESKIKYSLDEIVAELHAHPERFSPNVILRPLYEEYILPNLAYIGGGGEIAYWLERKTQFAAAGIPYPMLIRRNSLLMVAGSSKSQMDKLELTSLDILPGYDAIVKMYLRKHSQNELKFDEELEMIQKAYALLAAKAEPYDPTLSKAMLAEQTKQVKQFEQLGSRLLRAEKQLQETNLKRIQKIKEKLFPDGGLQERHDNFLSIYADYGPQWIETLVEICDPMERKFMILELPLQQEPEA